MPIKGVSEVRRLPRLGKIHLGEKVATAGGGERPQATDHFVVPLEVSKVYGDTPRELDIMFPVEDPEIFASQFYRAYTKSRGLVCRGNGETALRLIDVATKTGDEDGEIRGDIPDAKATEVEWVEDIPCPGQSCSYYQQKMCRELMMLQFVLPEVPGLGIWQLDTSSYHGIVNINSSLDLVRSMFGRVAGIPLVLTLEPMEVAPDGRKKTIYVLHLRSRQTVKALLPAGQEAAPAVLPAPEGETPDLLYPSQEEQTVPAQDDASVEEVPPSTPPAIANPSDLFNRAMKELGYMNAARVLESLGCGKTADILNDYGTLDAAWDVLDKRAKETASA